MPAIRPDASKRIDKAFAELKGFQKEHCIHLRKLVHKALKLKKTGNGAPILM